MVCFRQLVLLQVLLG
jgi:hypothetical protein